MNHGTAAAPMFFQAGRPGNGYAKAATARFQAIQADLCKDIPHRKGFLMLVKEICIVLGEQKEFTALRAA